MIFSERSIQDTMTGRKTQTRRIVQASDWLRSKSSYTDRRPYAVLTAKGHLKWQVGRDYAVQPGRGRGGVLWNDVTQEWATQESLQSRGDLKLAQLGGWQPLRIRILHIRQEDVREISAEDVTAEGFDSRVDFWRVWCSMHDKTILSNADWELLTRPTERYQAWVLGYEVM